MLTYFPIHIHLYRLRNLSLLQDPAPYAPHFFPAHRHQHLTIIYTN